MRFAPLAHIAKLGGVTAHKSSQISTPKLPHQAEKRISTPKGTLCPKIFTFFFIFNHW